MLKYVLLGSAMAVATPVLAQDAGMTQPTAPAATPMTDVTQAAPADTATTAAPAADTTATKKMSKTDRKAAEAAAAAPASEPAQSADAASMTQPAPATTATPAQAATAATDPAAAAPAAAQPAAGDQVAAIVESEFGSYDKDGNGTLSKTEFAAWMTALKAKAPNAAAQPADPKWNDAAFAQADSDKSASVTKQELTGFLGSAARAG